MVSVTSKVILCFPFPSPFMCKLVSCDQKALELSNWVVGNLLESCWKAGVDIMADRDAFIVICWLAILALMFFECFYRKLKNKFNRDIQPPQLPSSAISDSERESCREELSSELTHHYHHNDHHDRNNNRGGGTGGGGPFIGPISITSSSKDMCRISMEMGHEEDEEPPPSYQEALSYAKLVTKFHFSPYGDTDIRISEETIESTSSSGGVRVRDSSGSGSGGGCRVVNLNDHHHSSDSCTSAKCPINAVFPPHEEETENSEEDDDETDESSDSLTDVDSDTETLINERIHLAPRARHTPNNDECNNVIMSSSLSISKKFESFASEKNNSKSENVVSASTVRMKGSSRELSSIV